MVVNLKWFVICSWRKKNFMISAALCQKNIQVLWVSALQWQDAMSPRSACRMHWYHLPLQPSASQLLMHWTSVAGMLAQLMKPEQTLLVACLVFLTVAGCTVTFNLCFSLHRERIEAQSDDAALSQTQCLTLASQAFNAFSTEPAFLPENSVLQELFYNLQMCLLPSRSTVYVIP